MTEHEIVSRVGLVSCLFARRRFPYQTEFLALVLSRLIRAQLLYKGEKVLSIAERLQEAKCGPEVLFPFRTLKKSLALERFKVFLRVLFLNFVEEDMISLVHLGQPPVEILLVP
uniref:Uncharacterized protein n=1 Tax=Cacopsylla melanoneura TaxID=428564 RepID=A0A8D8Z8L4_9HEMI